MKNVIFYFSGTGNTYWAAKTMADKIGDCELINIAGYDCRKKIKAQRAGIFYPVYYWGLPNIIKKFAGTAEIDAQYIFELHTMGGYDGIASIQLKNCLSAKNEKLSASYRIKMPNNISLLSRFNHFTDVVRIPTDKKIKTLIKRAQIKMQMFSSMVQTMQPHNYTDFFFAWHKYGYNLNEQQCADFRNKGSEFASLLENSCTGCGKCSKVCPVSNISIVSGRPVWGDKCEFCSACLNSCPVKAINYGYSKGKRRYVFPLNKDTE